MKRRTASACGVATLLSLAAAQAVADVKPAPVFGSGMVLQQGKPIPVWGWAEPGESVTVEFAGQAKTAVAGAKGAWAVRLDPLEASRENRPLVIAGRNHIEFKDVLVGEVWLCSGQSNMQWPLSRAADGAAAAAAAAEPLMRLATVKTVLAPRPAPIQPLVWQPSNPTSAAPFSAVGYYFGRELARELAVPIGLINASWGGSSIEAWTPACGFRRVPELADIARQADTWDPRMPAGMTAFTDMLARMKEWIPRAELALAEGRQPDDPPPMPEPPLTAKGPTAIYNGMVHDLAPCALRGVIWYQGEANSADGALYVYKMQALIGGWRMAFERPDLPVYFVQLANYLPDGNSPQGGQGYAPIREAQRRCLDIPHTGMAVAIDVGDPATVHPTNKRDVGWRLALWALAREYNRPIECSGPLYRAHKVEGTRVRISFDHVGAGLMAGRKTGPGPAVPDEHAALKRFAVAGADKGWVWAEAVMDGDSVLVSSPKVPEPAAVRYAYDNNPVGCNLYNRDGLPAAPFRTDAW